MRELLIKFVATGFGTGYAPQAPGLFGSVAGLIYWWALGFVLGMPLYWAIYVAGVIIALWTSDRAAILFNLKDPSKVVIDELVAVPLALMGLGASWWEVVAAFVFFRLYDVWKPGLIRRSQSLRGGWGICVDDQLAALYACATCHALRWLAGQVISR